MTPVLVCDSSALVALLADAGPAGRWRLTIERWPYSVVSARAWELRHHVSVYKASYVAVAEQLEAPLISLDTRLAQAHGLRCQVETP